MSLRSREDEGGGNSSLIKKRKRADIMKERYEQNTINNLIKQAEYKSGVGMELSDSERFVIENKQFLLRKKAKMTE